jgi:AcrR family transcriptional regulator
MKLPTKRKRQAEERRKQLIDTALGLFAAKGFENTTTKEIAEASGVAQGLIYHYFGGKEELLFAAVDRHGFLPRLRVILAASSERPAREVLPRIVEGFRALLGEKDDLVRVFFRESQVNPEVGRKLAETIQEGVELLSGYLRARIAAGELRDLDPEAAAKALLYAVQMAHMTREPAGTFERQLVENLLRGIEK